MSKPRRHVQRGTCVYCGNFGEVEQDHVVPRSLFVSSNQSSIKVWSCVQCNRTKSDGEGDLRDYMITSINAREHRAAAALLPKFQKSNAQGKSRVGIRAANAPLVDRLTPAGLIIGEMLGDMDHFPEMERTLGFIVRGLYSNESGNSLPQDVPVDTLVINFSMLDEILKAFEIPQLPPFRTLGPDVFRWQALGLGQANHQSGWIMVFYGAIPVIGVTANSLVLPKHPPRVVDPLTAKPRGTRARTLHGLRDLGVIELPPSSPLDFLYELKGQYPNQ